MDLLQLVEENSVGLRGSAFESGLSAVIRHLRRAEVYLVKGRANDDEDYFNDVIYRTNQAYEGILKEGYELFTGKSGDNLRTAQLEQHFARESILSTRVSNAFQGYRQEWRNPSTHDHRLVFSEQDATLALSTISTFVYLLLDQMIEVRASQLQHQRTQATSGRQRIPKADKSLGELVASSLMDHALGDALARFSKDAREIEIVGTVHGHLAAMFPGFKIDHDAVLAAGGLTWRPDLLIDDTKHTVVVEIKRLSSHSDAISHAIKRLEVFLNLRQTSEGVLYLVPFEPQDSMMQVALRRQFAGKSKKPIFLVATPDVARAAEKASGKLGFTRLD